MDDQERSWAYQFYPTPQWLARHMIARAEIGEEDIILEPSAGDGRMLRLLREQLGDQALIECCELMPEHHDLLVAQGWKVVVRDFLQCHRYAFYTRIVANPPFTRGQDMRHVRHMYALLASGGRMVSVMSAHHLTAQVEPFISFRAWLDGVGATQEVFPESTFEELGIDVKTVVVTIDK
jgi:hypothetical protein